MPSRKKIGRPLIKYSDKLINYIQKKREENFSFTDISNFLRVHYDKKINRHRVSRIYYNQDIYRKKSKSHPPILKCISKQSCENILDEISINDAVHILSELSCDTNMKSNKLYEYLLTFLNNKNAESLIVSYGEKGMKLGKYLPSHGYIYHRALKKYPNSDYRLNECCDNFIKNNKVI